MNNRKTTLLCCHINGVLNSPFGSNILHNVSYYCQKRWFVPAEPRSCFKVFVIMNRYRTKSHYLKANLWRHHLLTYGVAFPFLHLFLHFSCHILSCCTPILRSNPQINTHTPSTHHFITSSLQHSNNNARDVTK